MKLKFSWLNSRKSLILKFFIDLILFIYLFIYIFKDSISNIYVLLTLNFLNTFIWIISSYIIGRYSNPATKKFDIVLNHFSKTLLNITLNLISTQVIFRFFWDWNYMNFASFSNFLNDFLSLYKNIFILSGLSQCLINLYLSKKFSNKLLWLFLGNNKKALFFKNLIKSKKNYQFKNFNQKYLRNKTINVKGIVIDEEEIINKKNIQFLFELNNKGMKFMKLSSWCERYLNRYPSELVKATDLIEGIFSYDEFSIKARIKRIGESILSFIIIILTLPILLISALLIKIEDKGPIFYSQIRNGFEGKQFKIIKLRTMVIDAEKNGIQWAEHSDKRVTKIGKILRKLRIDEIPQLLLVLSGEMSLIGPRPERPKIDILLREHIPNYDLRYSIKPGISGWAQVNYPYGASFEDSKLKLSYDIYYIKNFSILLDCMILFKTIKLVINGKGSVPIKKKKDTVLNDIN